MGAFVITLREGFEAALIVSLILAYLAKTGNLERHSRAVWIGVASAIGFSIAVGAILFAWMGELEGTGEEVYEGVAMIAAASVVTWMVFWMRKQAATIGAHLRAQVDRSLLAGGGLALAGVAFVGVGREGIETALFLFASVGESGALVTVIAALAGLVVAVMLGVMLYRGALRLDLKRFFTITGVLVIAFAAWLLYGGIHAFGEVAESEALESLGPLVALVYALGFGYLYLRGIRRPPTLKAEASADAAPAAADS